MTDTAVNDTPAEFRTDLDDDPAPDADVCVDHDCTRTDDLRVVVRDGVGRVLCPAHCKDFLGVST